MLRDKLGRFIRHDTATDFFLVNGKLSLPALIYLLSLFPASYEILKLNSLPALIVYLAIYALPYILTLINGD